MWKMKINLLLIIIAVLGLLLSSCSNVGAVQTELGFSIPKQSITYFFDDHGGFHGDGETVIVFTPSAEFAESIPENWNPTPVYPEIYPDIFAIAAPPFPKENLSTEGGFWLWVDCSPDAVYSHNIAFAYFDGKTCVYYELDT